MDGAARAPQVSDTGSQAHLSFFVATPWLLADGIMLGSQFFFAVSFVCALALRDGTATEASVVFIIVGDLESGLGRRSFVRDLVWCGAAATAEPR